MSTKADTPKVKAEKAPLTFRIAKWYGYIFSLCYLLYGGINIILGVLDHNYDNMAQPFIFVLLGVLLIIIAFAFAEGRRWGWYGMVAISGLMVVGALVSLRFGESYVLLVIGLGALGVLLMPTTKNSFF